MPKLKNFLPLARSYFDHELWNEEREFSKAEAWLWMLKEARYSETEGKKWINGRLVTWEKGEILGAIRYLKKAWNWNSNGKVYRFLEYLKDEQMIEVSTEQGVNVITLCNHPTYNKHLYANGTHNGTPTNTRNNGNDGPSSKEEAPEAQGDVSSNSNNSKSATRNPEDLQLTKQLVSYWNECHDTRLRVAKSRKKVSQVRQRRKSFDIEEMKKAIFNHSKNQWVHENNQQSNWDALMRNDNKLEHWLHREPENEPGKENTHPTERGYAKEEKAKAHAEEHRRPFKESIYPSIEYKGETYYKIPQN